MAFFEKVGKFGGEAVHFFFKWLAVVFLVGNSHKATGGEDIVLLGNIFGGDHCAEALLIGKRAVLERMECVGYFGDVFHRAEFAHFSAHHFAHGAGIDKERFARLLLLAREKPQRHRYACAVE